MYCSGKVNIRPKTGVEIRYYKKDEWFRLPKDQRDECVEIRQKRLAEERTSSGASNKKSRVSSVTSLEIETRGYE